MFIEDWDNLKLGHTNWPTKYNCEIILGHLDEPYQSIIKEYLQKQYEMEIKIRAAITKVEMLRKSFHND